MFFRIAVFTLAAAPMMFGQTQPLNTRYTDIPFVPTPLKVVDAMLNLADVKPGDVLIDLGSGDGRIVIAAAKKYGIRAIGIEIDPELVRESEKNAQEVGVADKVRFIKGDLFGQDLRQASIVTLFLTPGVNLRLRPKLLKELKPGTRVVSRTFNMGAWAPSKTVQVDNDRVYLWVIPDEKTRSK
jgi:precorrin-6B methylase 2